MRLLSSLASITTYGPCQYTVAGDGDKTRSVATTDSQLTDLLVAYIGQLSCMPRFSGSELLSKDPSRVSFRRVDTKPHAVSADKERIISRSHVTSR